MKKIITLVAAVAAAASVFTACDNKDDVKTVSAVITVDDSDIESSAKAEAYTVTLTNNSTSLSYTVQTENSIATFDGLVPGVYSATVSAETVVDGFQYVISGSVASESIITEATAITVKVTATKASALILKEIYYNGCTVKTPEEAGDDYGETYFRDQFYEIYNNSTETVYADGLCLTDNGNSFASYDFSTIYTYDIANPENYLFVQTVWTIPGSGTDYPVAPGESIIVAQWATDHNAESLANGKSISTASAEFEALMGESSTWDGTVLTDNDAINMTRTVLAGYAAPQWLISVYTANIILFKPSVELKNEDFLVANESSYTKAREILRSDVLDAVQWMEQETDFAEPTHRRLPTAIDAGCNFLTAYNGKSIARKVAGQREDGTYIYQDTNNTTNDFTIETPVMRRNGAKIPSWNTWANK
ncbi:MAG: DUF4876 domain-containing protein [Bacteroidales bacterium]|nr:DUF4876 domain-containing protein [Bacteroidales bacterium]